MPNPRSQEFSAHPCRHYLLTLIIPLLLLDLTVGERVYFCWHTISGLSSEFCSSDRVLNEETAGSQAISSHFSVILVLLLIPVLAAIYEPFFVIARCISQRLHIHQNLVGAAYWIIAWTLVGFGPLAIVAAATFILDIGSPARHQQRAAEWMFLALILGAHGAFSGVVYCILAFRRRGRAAAD